MAAQARRTTYNVWSRAERLAGIDHKTDAILAAVRLSHRRDTVALICRTANRGSS